MLISTLAAILSLSAQSGTTACPGDAANCWQEGEDIILANEADAEFLMPYLQMARQRFETLHGFEAPKAAIVFDDIDHQDLSDAGYSVILPWFLPWQREARIRSAIEAGVRGQTAGLGLSEDRIQAMIAQGAAAAGLSNDDDDGEPRDLVAGGAMHELGHLWLIHAYDWPTSSDDRNFYGVETAPDWMDEVAAVLLENDGLTAGRRNHLRSVLNGEDRGEIVPLNIYFSIDHPLLNATSRRAETMRAAAEAGARGQQTQVLVLSGEEADEMLAGADGMDPTLFYSQSRGFIDYVGARSGGEQYFVDAALAVLDGQVFAEWHEANAARYSLPVAMDMLEADWRSWLTQSYGR